MATEVTRLTHKMLHNCTLWQRAVPIALLAPKDQSGNFLDTPSYHITEKTQEAFNIQLNSSAFLTRMFFVMFVNKSCSFIWTTIF